MTGIVNCQWGQDQVLLWSSLVNGVGGYHGVSASLSSHLRSLSSHLIFTFLIFTSSNYQSSVFTPVISPILHFFTLKKQNFIFFPLKNPDLQSSEKTGTPPIEAKCNSSVNRICSQSTATILSSTLLNKATIASFVQALHYALVCKIIEHCDIEFI